jgi:DNA repair photolyase
VTPSQPSLFDDGFEVSAQPVQWPIRLGHAVISEKPTGSILTRASGFMSDYDYTLNPYSGCSFACSYCYAAFFSRDLELQNTWGQWVQAKTNAVDVLRRMRTDLSGKSVYMSSVTDPYQPIERRLGLVKDLLPILAERGVRLVVQTRSPLVTRDIEVLKRFEHVRVNMTVTTDSRQVQSAFEPQCATSEKRLQAITQIREAGISCSITMTPLLPVADPLTFAQRLKQTGVEHFVVQPFHADRGRFVAGTRERAMKLTQEMGWDDVAYRKTVEILRANLPHLDEGREGFAPE